VDLYSRKFIKKIIKWLAPVDEGMPKLALQDLVDPTSKNVNIDIYYINISVVLCAGVAGAGVLPELRRFFRRRSRSRILYAGARSRSYVFPAPAK
jgi:hypothetical protein